MKNQNLKGAKLSPLGVFQKLMIYNIMVPGRPFSAKCEKTKSLYICQYITGIFSIRVSNTRCSDMANAMDTLF